MIYALRVTLDGWKPWEYDNFSAWRYAELLNARNAWEDARRLYPVAKQDEQHQPLPIRQDGTGPQFVTAEGA